MGRDDSQIRRMLFEAADNGYKQFQSKLMPTVCPETVIGVRTPVLRRLAAKLRATAAVNDFLSQLPHEYYEENNLHSFLISSIKDYDTAMYHTERFLPYIDNWATCDSLRPKVFSKCLPQLYGRVKVWIKSDHEYTVRFAIGVLLSYYLDDGFSAEHLRLVSSVHSERYYVRMMSAWYFATALAKQYDSAVAYLEDRRLDTWTHNKTIQKSVESRRITPAQKEYLKTLRIREK